jgi:hypothetical protein
MLQMPGAKMKAMKYGYARVSTDDQTPALQLVALKMLDAKLYLRTKAYQEPRRNSLYLTAGT